MDRVGRDEQEVILILHPVSRIASLVSTDEEDNTLDGTVPSPLNASEMSEVAETQSFVSVLEMQEDPWPKDMLVLGKGHSIHLQHSGRQCFASIGLNVLGDFYK